MPRSLRICAPSPTSRHCRVRASSDAGVVRFGIAITGTPAVPSRRNTRTPRALGLEARQRPAGSAWRRRTRRVMMLARCSRVSTFVAVADAAMDEGHVIDRIERRHEGVAVERADLGFDGKFADALDQLVARLPVGDQVGDRDALQLVLARRRRRGRGPRITVPSSFISSASTPTGGKLGEPAEIDAGFGMARAHQHAALLGHQRKHMAGPHEIGGAAVAVGERAHGVGALLRRDAGGQAVADVDRDGEGGAERRVVARHHRIEMQAPRLLGRSGAQTMPEVWRMMKAIFSGVHSEAATNRSPSFSRSSSSATTTISPRAKAATAALDALAEFRFHRFVCISSAAASALRAARTATPALSPTWPRWRR